MGKLHTKTLPTPFFFHRTIYQSLFKKQFFVFVSVDNILSDVDPLLMHGNQVQEIQYLDETGNLITEEEYHAKTESKLKNKFPFLSSLFLHTLHTFVLSSY